MKNLPMLFKIAIADCCGRTLTKFQIDSNNALVNFKTRSPLQALTELEVRYTNIYNFEYHSQLKKLSVVGAGITHFDWLIKPFPQLEIVKFVVIDLKEYQAIKFLKLNPQLKVITIKLCKKIMPLIIKDIAILTPNLEKLSLELKYYKYQIYKKALDDILVNISNLWKLKSLIILSWGEVPFDRLVDAFIEKEVPIEEFGIFGEYHLTHKLNVPQLKLLKVLCLPQMSNETLIKFFKKIPTLERMTAIKSPNITVKGIKGALEYGKQLCALTVETENIVIDMDDYNSILKLAKGRVKVQINTSNGSTNIPSDLLRANREWFNIGKIINIDIYNRPWQSF